MQVMQTPISDESRQKVCDVLDGIFEHIDQVQKDVSSLNFDAMEKINDFVFNSGLDVNDEIFVALQHQDILTQQLSAISELSQNLKKHMDEVSDDFDTLESKFLYALELARAKKEAYRGNAF